MRTYKPCIDVVLKGLALDEYLPPFIGIIARPFLAASELYPSFPIIEFSDKDWAVNSVLYKCIVYQPLRVNPAVEYKIRLLFFLLFEK